MHAPNINSPLLQLNCNEPSYFEMICLADSIPIPCLSDFFVEGMELFFIVIFSATGLLIAKVNSPFS